MSTFPPGNIRECENPQPSRKTKQIKLFKMIFRIDNHLLEYWAGFKAAIRNLLPEKKGLHYAPHPFIHLFIYSLIDSFFPFINPTNHVFFHSFISLSSQLFIHLSINWNIYSLIRLFIYKSINPFILSFIHPFIHQRCINSFIIWWCQSGSHCSSILYELMACDWQRNKAHDHKFMLRRRCAFCRVFFFC